jgi:hypothetical protein
LAITACLEQARALARTPLARRRAAAARFARQLDVCRSEVAAMGPSRAATRSPL